MKIGWGLALRAEAEKSHEVTLEIGIVIIIIIITVFIQRLTHRRLVYNGITQV